jgi:hypothetical protein
MLNLNFNTLYSKLAEQPRGYYQPTVSASFFLYGAGGAGGFATTGDNSNYRGGAGGGAGMIVSGTINITPDSEYTFIIPNSCSRTDTKGEDSFFNGYDGDTIYPISVRAGGGYRPPYPNSFNGGNSGDGVYNHPNFTASYSAKTAGIGVFNTGYGGGAGSHTNGGAPSSSLGVLKGGSGGNGITSSITLFGWSGSFIDPSQFLPNEGLTSSTIGSAGGGAADRWQFTTGDGLTGNPGDHGVVNGGVAPPGTVVDNIAGIVNGRGPGAGGSGDTINFTTSITTSNASGVGGAGALIITYTGIPKLQFSGSVVTNYDAVNNATAHWVLYNASTNGTGSFLRSSQGPFDNDPNINP